MDPNHPQIEIKSEFCFFEGECFDSFEAFLNKLELHSANDLVYYWRRDSRTIEGAAMKTSRPIAPALRYYSVRYSCIFGGQKFEQKSNGTKKLRPSIRNDCPAFITLRATKCGQQLMVMSVLNIHNHAINAEAIKKLSHHKKLSTDMKHRVMELLFHNVNKKLIREYVRVTIGKELTTKDLFNLMAALKKNPQFEDKDSDIQKTESLTTELIKYINDHGNGTVELELLKQTPYVAAPISTGSEIEMLEERLMEDFDSNHDEKANDSISDQKIDASHGLVIEVLDERASESISQAVPNRVKSKNRPRWRNPSCFTCGANNRLVQAQLQVLRARKDKIREEIKLLRLRKRKLTLEMRTGNRTYYPPSSC